MGKRNFEEVSAIPIGAQSSDDRFRQQDRSERPTFADWRCNLTGLSQVHNLYFVAYNESLYCYTPQFPSQEIPQYPALIIDVDPLDEAQAGRIDPQRPHAINNLVVEFLGDDEVVAVARDDGDVNVMLVRHIMYAIQRRAELMNGIGVEAYVVPPIFETNAGASAWGLAIHSQSRTIAVSANTHDISVFRFGLIVQDDHVDEGGLPNPQEVDVSGITYTGTSNIPHISFCNTGDDPHGRWLLATDITGYCRTLDLRIPTTAQSFRFARPRTQDSFDRWNAGWGIMFLDRRSFVPEVSLETALGLSQKESLPGVGFRPTESVWDIWRTAYHVPDRNENFVHTPKQKRQANRVSTPARSQTQSLDDEQLSTTAGLGFAETSEVDPVAMPEPSETQTNSNLENNTSTFTDEDMASDPDDDVSPVYFDPDEEEGVDLDRDPELGSQGIRQKDLFYSKQGNLCGDLPCPILHTSAYSVYLIQPSDKRAPEQQSPFTSPTIAITDALRQEIHARESTDDFRYFERLNMHAYIPSIGVVIIASQKGRALVISLTRVIDPRCPERKTIYTMRIDQILPYGRQEVAGERPLAPLAGIAVGPMQGTERRPADRKRWRLFMMYTDHTVLSYEIRRQRKRDSAVDLANVTV